MPPTLSIVIPCYNEEEIIYESLLTINKYLDVLILSSIVSTKSNVIFVDDGSSDATYDIIRSYKSDRNVVVKLSGNKGHQTALLAGLEHAFMLSDCCISLDADLQHDIYVIEDMIKHFINGKHIIYGVRKRRVSESFFKRKSGDFFYWVMGKMGAPIIANHSDFRLLSKKALIELFKYKETNLFLRGLLPLIQLPSEMVFFDQNPRVKGKSKYTIKKMISLAINAVTSHSVIPIRLVTISGFLTFLVTIFLSINVLVAYVSGNVVPGWASISLPLYFLGGIQLLSLGIIGEYIGKIYKETKRRPKYHIEEIID